VALALALPAGCARKPPEALPCPRPAILDGAQTLERRSGPGPADFAWRATLTGFGGGCRFEADATVIRLALDLAVVAGPRATPGAAIEVPWFVAVADPSGRVIDKQGFTTRVEPAAGPGPRLLSEQIEQRIQGVGAAEAPAWRVYLGLEVEPEEGLRRLRERARQAP
jgi:hypothetical protein